MKYADAGVNIAVADDAKQRIRHHASRTFTPCVLSGIGSFGGLFALPPMPHANPIRGAKSDLSGKLFCVSKRRP